MKEISKKLVHDLDQLGFHYESMKHTQEDISTDLVHLSRQIDFPLRSMQQEHQLALLLEIGLQYPYDEKKAEIEYILCTYARLLNGETRQQLLSTSYFVTEGPLPPLTTIYTDVKKLVLAAELPTNVQQEVFQERIKKEIEERNLGQGHLFFANIQIESGLPMQYVILPPTRIENNLLQGDLGIVLQFRYAQDKPVLENLHAQYLSNSGTTLKRDYFRNPNTSFPAREEIVQHFQSMQQIANVQAQYDAIQQSTNHQQNRRKHR